MFTSCYLLNTTPSNIYYHKSLHYSCILGPRVHTNTHTPLPESAPSKPQLCTKRSLTAKLNYIIPSIARVINRPWLKFKCSYRSNADLLSAQAAAGTQN